MSQRVTFREKVSEARLVLGWTLAECQAPSPRTTQESLRRRLKDAHMLADAIADVEEAMDLFGRHHWGITDLREEIETTWRGNVVIARLFERTQVQYGRMNGLARKMRDQMEATIPGERGHVDMFANIDLVDIALEGFEALLEIEEAKDAGRVRQMLTQGAGSARTSLTTARRTDGAA